MREIDEITGIVLDIAVRLHRDLGPDLPESVYETVVAKLSELGNPVARQRSVDFEVEGLRFESAFRIDLFVDERVLVEIKSVERLNAAYAKQLLTCLRLNQSARRAAYQFRRRDAQGGGATDRRWPAPPRLRASA